MDFVLRVISIVQPNLCYKYLWYFPRKTIPYLPLVYPVKMVYVLAMWLSNKTQSMV